MNKLYYFLFGLLGAFSLHIIIGSSCFEQNPTKPDDNTANIKAINESAKKLEELFLAADTTQLKSLLTDVSTDIYSRHISQIQPVMNDYGKAIQNRSYRSPAMLAKCIIKIEMQE